MAEKVEFELVANTSGAVAGVNKVDEAVKKTSKTTKKASKELSGMQQVGGAVLGKLDQLTGGLASKLVAVGSAAKLSGKAMKTALISSGIGLAVVAIGLIVEHWDAISELLGFVNKDLEKQVELNAENLKLTTEQLSEIDLRIKLEKKQGGNADELIKKRKELIKLQKAQILLSIADLKTQELDLTNEAKKVGFWERFSNDFMKRTKGMNKVTRDMMGKITDEEDKLIKGKTSEIRKLEMLLLNIQISETPDAVKDTSAVDADNAQKERNEAIERIRKGLIDTEAEERAEKLRLINEDYTEQIALAAKFYGTNSIKILELKAAQKKAEDEQKAVFTEQDKAKQDKIDQEAIDKEKKRLEDIQNIVNDATDLSELEKIEKDRLAAQTELDLLGATWIEKARIAAYYQGLINEETTKQNKEANEKQKEDDEKLQDAKFRVASQALNAISSIGNLFAGENEKNAKTAFKISKAVGIAQAGINTSQAIMKAAAETTDVTPTQSLRTANMIALGIAGAAQIASIAAQKFEGGSSTVPKPSLGGGSQAPAFNVVGASGETQLADAIGSQTQRPTRAFVVSNDVTTAQELDRNIIEGASIG